MLDFNKPNFTPVYRFEREDEVIIQGRSFKPYYPTADGYSFEPVDGNGPVVQYNHETIAAWVNRDDLIHDPGKFSPHAGLSVHRTIKQTRSARPSRGSDRHLGQKL